MVGAYVYLVTLRGKRVTLRAKRVTALGRKRAARG
jgi:hypothetical protein